MLDSINALFEASASIFILLHVRRVWQDRLVRGVSVPAIGFFFLWGLWNIFYYPSIDQFYSFLGGLAVVAANFAYVASLIYFTWREKCGR